MDFETLWQIHERKVVQNMTMKKRMRTGSLIVALSLLSLSIGGFAAQNFLVKDKIDYSFVAEERLIGEWEVVDLVKNPEDFKAESKNDLSESTFSQLAFISDGSILLGTKDNAVNPYTYSSFTYTKDHIINAASSTDSKYEIRTINNDHYLFMQWKSGAYLKGLVSSPPYYVLKQVNTHDLKDYKPKVMRSDKTDLPFETDPLLLGTWHSVDIISNINNFSPYERQFAGELHLKSVKMLENGLASAELSKKPNEFAIFAEWTKGLLIDKNNAVVEAYTIKEVDGKTYLFLPWISGDVVYGGKSPDYYVLEKE